VINTVRLRPVTAVMAVKELSDPDIDTRMIRRWVEFKMLTPIGRARIGRGRPATTFDMGAVWQVYRQWLEQGRKVRSRT
jgi:hypothetical protein